MASHASPRSRGDDGAGCGIDHCQAGSGGLDTGDSATSPPHAMSGSRSEFRRSIAHEALIVRVCAGQVGVASRRPEALLFAGLACGSGLRSRACSCGRPAGRTRDGSVVRYLTLAHNERHPRTGSPVAEVIHNFGRADKVDRDALARLVSSIPVPRARAGGLRRVRGGWRSWTPAGCAGRARWTGSGNASDRGGDPLCR
jgi:hypothetical protein